MHVCSLHLQKEFKADAKSPQEEEEAKLLVAAPSKDSKDSRAADYSQKKRKDKPPSRNSSHNDVTAMETKEAEPVEEVMNLLYR